MSSETLTEMPGRAGTFVSANAGPEGYSVFIPKPLPPSPPLDITPRLQGLLDRANQALGRLDGVTLLLPDPDQFLYTYIRKEAVLSSQIEGTQSSLSDLLLFENDAAPGVPVNDARETFNYIGAMSHGLRRIQSGELPLCLRLLREVHAHLLIDTQRRLTRPRVSSGPHRTGSAGRVLAMHGSCLRRHTRLCRRWAPWSAFCTMSRYRHRSSSRQRWRMRNLRPSIPFWMATGESGGC